MADHILLIMRHADAEHGRPGLPDAERQLTPVGHRRAAAQADALTAVVAAHPPDVVLCSAAARTTQTLAHLDVGDAEVRVDAELYGASATSLLLRLAELSEETGCAWVIGHMPTVGQLAMGLTAGMPVDDFDPGTAVVLRIPGPWADLQPHTATLLHHAP